MSRQTCPITILHGDSDVSIDHQENVEFKECEDSVGTEIGLSTFKGADHTERMLIETERYVDELIGFY